MRAISRESARPAPLMRAFWKSQVESSRFRLPRSQLAERQTLLHNDTPFFIADLQADDGVGLVPVDLNGAEVHVEIGQADAVRIDFVREADSRLAEIATGRVEAAAGDVEEGIARAEGAIGCQAGNLRQVPVAADDDDSVGFGLANQSQQAQSLAGEIA